jgi:hypothetical protein
LQGKNLKQNKRQGGKEYQGIKIGRKGGGGGLRGRMPLKNQDAVSCERSQVGGNRKLVRHRREKSEAMVRE